MKRQQRSGPASTSRPAKDDVALQVMVPPRLKKALGVRAAREGTTQRTIVLKALRAAGFEVAEEEMCDRRKVRS